MDVHLLLDQTLDPTAKWLVLAASVLMILIAVFRPFGRKNKDPLKRAAGFTSLAQQRSVERQMQNVLVEMANMARQISAQLDTRAAKLEALIQEADQKIAAMKASPGSPPTREMEPEGLPLDPRHAQIYALADQGRSPQEIAQQLDRSSGEVELILALRR